MPEALVRAAAQAGAPGLETADAANAVQITGADDTTVVVS